MYSEGPGADAVKLPGGLPGTTTFLYNGPKGTLIVEMYDHSDEAESAFGNDVAFLLHVAAVDRARVENLLRQEARGAAPGRSPDLFALMRARFESYHEIQKWFDANSIAYRKEFDSRA